MCIVLYIILYNYVLCIVDLGQQVIFSIERSPVKKGSPVSRGFTVECASFRTVLAI